LVTHVRTFPLRFRPDLQIALDQIFATQRRPTKTLGLHRKFDYQTLTFPDLWLEGQHEAVPVGPLQHVDVDIGEDRPVKCLRQVLWLLDHQGQRYAVMFGEADRYGDVSGIRLEIAVPPGESGLELAEHYYKSLEEAVRQARSYRGKVLSLESLEHVNGQAGEIQVHRLPAVTREDVILPARTMELMERNIFGFFAQRDRLAKLKLSTKKGLLFHGGPRHRQDLFYPLHSLQAEGSYHLADHRRADRPAPGLHVARAPAAALHRGAGGRRPDRPQPGRPGQPHAGGHAEPAVERDGRPARGCGNPLHPDHQPPGEPGGYVEDRIGLAGAGGPVEQQTLLGGQLELG